MIALALSFREHNGLIGLAFGWPLGFDHIDNGSCERIEPHCMETSPQSTHTWVDGSVCLDATWDDAADHALDLTIQPAHDTRGQSVVEAERAPYGKHL